jgi:hypothetical protein
MPYRRLPNTDQSRIRALHTAIDRCSMTDVPEMAFSIKAKNEAEFFLPTFESAHHEYLQCLDKQIMAGKKYQSQVKLARLYISHFIQVLNFGVIRKEIKLEAKHLYHLEPNDFTVPDLNTEASLLKWGECIIAGEQERIRQGGAPIYNPAIAKVRVHYDLFKDSCIAQKTFQKSTNRTLESIAQLRNQADGIILCIWNEVEEHFKNLPEPKRREMCEIYGLRYYYRKNEPRE